MTSVNRSRWYALQDFALRHGYKTPKHFTLKLYTDIFTDPALKKLPLHSKLYYLVPKPFMYELAYRASAKAQPLDILRKQIQMARAEYWLRKASEFPAVISAAVIEARYIVGFMRDPLSITGAQLQWIVALMLHCAGAFILGEMFGRKNVGGYGIVSPDWFTSSEGFRFSPVTW